MQSKDCIYHVDVIRQLEKIASQTYAVSSRTLMQRAGLAAYEALRHHWPHANAITVFCGGGNNGGDGYVLAHLAAHDGLQVKIWQVGSTNHLSEEAKEAWQACQSANISIELYSPHANIQASDLIVDAICGIGLTQTLRTDLINLIQRINALKLPVFSLDVPTGIQADTGQILGDAIQAQLTMTFIGLKLGLLTSHGVGFVGKLICHDLNLPAACFSKVKPCAEVMRYTSPYFPARRKDWHKGLSGHLLIIGGGPGYSGAARMAAMAALRVGVGLVTVATHPQHAAFLNINCPEMMYQGIESTKDLKPLLDKADAIVFGPGLTQTTWAKSLWQFVCEQSHPKVLDADALNLLAQTPMKQSQWILTPHPGEASRLLNTNPAKIQADRLTAALQIQQNYGGICVLKGAGTLIVSENELPMICDKGNAGMATAGMGDILSGVIGGLLAGGMKPAVAAKLGVFLHALAGDLAANAGERGMLATDLLPYLRQLCNTANRN